ncbi:MAG: type II toxin-antitoxin system RelE/ParE family toxin [Bryobacteraceae bacterium]
MARSASKPVTFVGSSLDDLRAFPQSARRETGFQLDKIQNGEEADSWKPMPTVGSGVQEIRVREESGAYRLMYVAKFPEAVYVLHAFQKKTRATTRQDLALAKERYQEVLTMRKSK